MTINHIDELGPPAKINHQMINVVMNQHQRIKKQLWLYHCNFEFSLSSCVMMSKEGLEQVDMMTMNMKSNMVTIFVGMGIQRYMNWRLFVVHSSLFIVL